MDQAKYIEANRLAWEQAAPVHKEATFEQLKKNFQQPDYIYLNQIALDLFKQLGLKNPSIAHLMCNNGRELISLKRLGAARCVGFDISAQFVSQGVELSQISGVECDFLCADVYDLSNKFTGQFDLVYLFSGSLIWLPDIAKFYQQVVQLLKPGGVLLVCEIHPLVLVFDPQDKRYPPVATNSYFSKKPRVLEQGLDYWRDRPYESAPAYVFQHTLSSILSQCVASGLWILHFAEHGLDLSARYSHLENKDVQLPLSFSLVAKKGRP